MSSTDTDSVLHLDNVASNLQLIADLAYGDVALAVKRKHRFEVIADARPNTAFAPMATSRVGARLEEYGEPEAFEASGRTAVVVGTRHRNARGIAYTTSAYPICPKGGPDAVVLVNRAEQVVDAPGTMEVAFMAAADELLEALRTAPLLDVRSGEPFSTERRAGDGVLRVDGNGVITYASPNGVTILRTAGAEVPIVGSQASAMPGGGFGISPVVGTRYAIQVEAEVAERTLNYRSIAVPPGVLVFVEDRTEARRREDELRVKDATIREVHHRVKNNLQTIASLLRIQARRTQSEEARHALAEATERVASMAVVHDLLAVGDEERIDFADAARTIVNLVLRGLVGDDCGIKVSISGETGLVDARVATSLALALAELVHNAVEHGLAGHGPGTVSVSMRPAERELQLKVSDDGKGLPPDFDPKSSGSLGLEIVRTVVEDDLHGTLTFSGSRGTTATVRIPLITTVER